MDERRWHNIRPNEQTRIPVRHVFVDTEARKIYDRGVETQQWRCAVGIYAARRKNGEYTTNDRDYVDPEALWADVSDFANSEGRTVVWCHNLAYDIRIAGVFTVLPARGWSLIGHNISPRGTWLEWRRDGRTLVFCDSFSVFPASIERIGQWFGIGKPALPSEDATMADWLDRCRADCRILSTCILRYLEWLKREDMGNWQLTGNSQAWAVYRHKFLTCKLTVHSETETLAMERRAMWAGRCEAYWHGKISGINVYEYDFQQAYPRIARDYAVPTKYVGELDSSESIWNAVGQDGYALIIECDVETTVPVVPAEHDGRILWPVGRFRTVLWDVEASEVMRAGGTVTALRARVYRTAPALKAWGQWILGELGKPDTDVPVWLKTLLKHWSRSLIGRMAMTYQSWEYDGAMPDSRCEAGMVKDERTGEVSEYIHVGYDMWLHAGKVEWQHSMPMITGYIQAIARMQLWEILSRMPQGSVLYADTDSVFVTEVDREELEGIIASIPGCGMRLKNAYQSMEIYGPRQIITGPEARIAGIPKKAERIEKGRFQGEVWESIGAAVAMGRIDSVQVRDRTWTLAGVDHRRRATDNGFTVPVELGMSDD